MPTIQLWNTELGKLTDYEVSVDRNGDIVCEYEDKKVNDTIKFPGGQTKTQFAKLVKAHNEANEGVKAVDTSAIEARDAKNQALLESL